MTIFWLLFIIFIIITIPFVIWGIKDNWYNLFSVIGAVFFAFMALFFLTFAIAQPISLRKEAVRQEKEREQIVYQIKNLTEESDRVKLNEWILAYNDWINEVNTSKEIYGWCSWYRDFNMTEHTIINLV